MSIKATLAKIVNFGYEAQLSKERAKTQMIAAQERAREAQKRADDLKAKAEQAQKEAQEVDAREDKEFAEKHPGQPVDDIDLPIEIEEEIAA